MKNLRKCGIMIAGLIVIMLLINVPDVMAQGCSLCSLNAAEQGPNAAKGLNVGILYIAAIPFVLIGVIGYNWYKHNGHAAGEE